MALMLIPVLLGFGITSKPLGATAFDWQQEMLSSVGTARMITDPDSVMGHTTGFRSDGLTTDDPLQFTIIDWLRFFSDLPDKSLLNGQKADIVGFVAHTEGTPDGMFTLSRFFMWHCVLDAYPIGLYVQSSDADSLREDTWVEVQGTFVVSEDGQWPILQADTIRVVPQPAIPYLHPGMGKQAPAPSPRAAGSGAFKNPCKISWSC